MTGPLDRQAPCPSCGAPITFKFAGARAVVCDHCRFVVARTDRGLQAGGRMADLIEIATPLQLHATGQWGGEPFEVEGRIQMDRAGAPGAPWQEILVGFPMSGRSTWVAYAQGRWYATSEVPLPAGAAPPVESLRPGAQVNLGPHGVWVVAEVGQRRVLSGEGAMTSVPAPGVVTRYADISQAGGGFGTIDYGDGSSKLAQLEACEDAWIQTLPSCGRPVGPLQNRRSHRPGARQPHRNPSLAHPARLAP